MHALGSRLIKLAIVSLLALAPARALAQPSPGGAIDLQLFRPAIDSKGFITQDASQVLGHLDVSFGLVLNYALSPLSLAGPPAAVRSGAATVPRSVKPAPRAIGLPAATR